MENYHDTIDFAREMDAKDPLRSFRERFYFPNKEKTGAEKLYFCGNSLGLQPKAVKEHIEVELEDWARLGVEGHVEGHNPWMHYQKRFTKSLAQLVGAQEQEVTPMNSLTTNLHLLMASFYRPKNKRCKIIMEAGAFSSDQYAIETQALHHGFDPKQVIEEVAPREGETYIRTEDIIQAINENADELAVVLFGGVNYYNGQFFDMKAITEAGHKVGAYVGFDLAHAIGNVPMQLHDWEVDFATWCSYKYLNSGPGGVSGIYIRDKWCKDITFPRLGGWWGQQEEERFEMRKGFRPEEGASGWQLSNVPILSMAAHRAALDLFDEAGMEAIRAKSRQLTGFLEFLVKPENNLHFADRYTIITPGNSDQRGAQLSLLFHTGQGERVFKWLLEQDVVVDWRHPNVSRLAPAPLYNSFEDVFRLAQLFREGMKMIT